ncbi:hypothetical protein [Flavobacterium sp. CLA17]|uniref:hypothetical protein n=1 Tax=Flavobacterium sp. CLA17 TaxID=2724135 RepID=UPI001491ADD1|nr:hypothetical protein [Flavobacterium sp. CLA17]QSB25249.1 hypothetical protein HAV12_012770 [Flavobacterium sp. CLA17]
MNFFFFLFGEQKNPGGVIGEIFAIRIYRALNLLKENQNAGFSFTKRRVADALVRYLLNIGMSFSIPLQSLMSFLEELPYFKNHIDRYFEFDSLQELYIIEEPASESIDKIFYDILTEIAIYFAWVETNDNNEINSKEIPTPPSDYTVELNKEGLRFDLDIEDDQIEDDLENILYAMF